VDTPDRRHQALAATRMTSMIFFLLKFTAVLFSLFLLVLLVIAKPAAVAMGALVLGVVSVVMWPV
jgi:hypothetical protein